MMTTPPLTQYLADVGIPAHLRSQDYVFPLVRHWCERQRYWHGPAHLRELLKAIECSHTGDEREILMLAAAYHDAIYDPRSGNNEALSAELLLQDAANPHSPVIRDAIALIRKSAWATAPESALEKAFFDLDTRQLGGDCTLGDRLRYEKAIFREYQFAPLAEYRKKRTEFLRTWAARFPQHARGTQECMELLDALRPRIAVYPGSFNPFHTGHLSILRQAEKSFEKVIVAVGINRQKAGSAESSEARHRELQERLRFHEVTLFDGLLSDYLETLPYDVTVVRGVRDGTDLEAELRFARFLGELRPGTNVVWIGCEPELQHVSSSAIRELESIKPGAGGAYLPETAYVYEFPEPFLAHA